MNEEQQKADFFVKHIEKHLKPDQKVICKICGKDIDQIYEEECKNEEPILFYEKNHG